MCPRNRRVWHTYHLELRQFPHNFCHFNLTELQLRKIVEPWVAGETVELGDRKWSPDRARLTILEGPEIPIGQLTMGRGWPIAQRDGEDVTGRVLAGSAQPERPAGLPATESPAGGSLADSLALEVLSLLADGPASLAEAWRLAGTRSPQSSAVESLALAEQALTSLVRSRLIVLLPAGAPPLQGVAGNPDAGTDKPEELLRAVESWTGDGKVAGVQMRRT
jgi:hypothetical protein